MTPGTVVRVLRLGSAGYVFEHAAYGRVTSRFSGHIYFDLVVLDVRDMQHMCERRGYHLGEPFNSLPQHLAPATEDDAAAAEALFALNGNAVFVKPFNKLTEGKVNEDGV
jgi:hypothetical protein